ncbi:NAD-dependent epimerase/dehydratase family protein [Bradyrhizobium cenepequi]
MIAILGATGYIGRSLAQRWAATRPDALALFARDPTLLGRERWPRHVSIRQLSEFDAGDFTLVINAIGAGDPARVSAMGAAILRITHEWDWRVLETMKAGTRYVFLSSGAIYGAGSQHPAALDDMLSLPVNRLGSVPPYLMAKLHAEALHRYARDRAILDVRVFGYADSSIPRSGTSFLAELVRSIERREPFVTSTDDMTRDYAGAQELQIMIECWLASGAGNRSADLYTQEPVTKHALLEAVQSRYGLTIQFSKHVGGSPTGAKPYYGSANHSAAEIGYRPQRTSMEIVLSALDVVAQGIA